MGNYNGTVRCGYCYERGHNAAACPKKKARVDELRASDPDHYMVREWDRKAEKRKQRATGKRVCAYCATHRKTISSWDWRYMSEADKAESGMIEATTKDRWGDTVTTGVEVDTLYGTEGERGVGHSIRACKYRKADIADKTSEVKCSRVNHLKRMLAIGYGPGATVAFADDCQAHDIAPGTFVITDVAWHRLGFEGLNGDTAYINETVANAKHIAHLFNPNPPYGSLRNVTLPMDALDVDTDGYRSRYADRVATLVTRASEQKVRNSIPFGWADGTDEKTQEAIMDILMENVKTRSKKK